MKSLSSNDQIQLLLILKLRNAKVNVIMFCRNFKKAGGEVRVTQHQIGSECCCRVSQRCHMYYVCVFCVCFGGPLRATYVFCVFRLKPKVRYSNDE